jgi:hypothetical protein
LGWGGEGEEGSVCAAAGEGKVGFGDGWWQDDLWPPDGIRRPVELRPFPFLFNWGSGRSWAGEVGPSGGVCHASCKKAHGKAISLPCVSKKRTAKALFAVRFSKNALLIKILKLSNDFGKTPIFYIEQFILSIA